MSRKDKQADLRRRMAEARSKLLAQSSIKGDEEEVMVEKKRKITHETVSQTVGGVGGILRKSKYTTQQPSVASKQNASSSHHQNATTSSIGALVDYGESSSDEDNVQESKNTFPSLQSTKIIEENNHQKPQMNNKNLIESSTSKQKIIPKVQDKEISDEVWDEFNAILDADEAASKVTLDITSSASLTKAATSEANEYDQTLLDSKDKSNNKLGQDDIRSNNKKEPPESTKSTKDDIYDNDEVNNMEQTSYEARLARLILLKNKKKKQSGLDNDVMEEVKLPTAGEFYDPTLAWAEEDEEDDDDNDNKGEEQTSSQPETSMNSNQTTSTPGLTNAPSAVAPPAVSMADILRRRRDEARMIASRGNDVNGEDDISDGNWF
jgi:hypothetical protein